MMIADQQKGACEHMNKTKCQIQNPEENTEYRKFLIGLNSFSADFMENGREEPELQERESL